MAEFLRILLPQLIEVGAPLAVTILSTLAGLALNALRRRFNHEAADRALERLERVVALTVHEVEQTLTPAVRDAAADGKITAEEAKGLRLTALTKAKNILGDKGMKELKASAGDLEQLMHSVVEAKVREMRVRESMPPPAA